MCNTILTFIGIVGVIGLSLWTIIGLIRFVPDLVRSVNFYRRHKKDYDGKDDVDKLEIVQKTIIKALNDYFNLSVYDDRSSYYGVDMNGMRDIQRELQEIVKERAAKQLKKFKRQEAEQKAKKRKK